VTGQVPGLQQALHSLELAVFFRASRKASSGEGANPHDEAGMFLPGRLFPDDLKELLPFSSSHPSRPFKEVAALTGG